MKMVRPQIILAIELSEADRLDSAASTLGKHKLVSQVERNKDRLLVTLGPGIEEYSAIASDLTAEGYRLKRFTEQEPDLEAAFMAFTKGSGDKI